MILSDSTLKDYIDSGKIICKPMTPASIQPASIDCRLGDEFLIVDSNKMTNLSLDSKVVYRKIKSDTITIPPNSFILGTTMEYIEIPDNIVTFVEGRSSIGRLGLFIQNAGWVDPGFKGQITLELYNANSLPIELKAGRRICQFVFAEMDTGAENPYGSHKHSGKYQGQMGTTGSKVFKDKSIDEAAESDG
jgi:dCTP deaminase